MLVVRNTRANKRGELDLLGKALRRVGGLPILVSKANGLDRAAQGRPVMCACSWAAERVSLQTRNVPWRAENDDVTGTLDGLGR